MKSKRDCRTFAQLAEDVILSQHQAFELHAKLDSAQVQADTAAAQWKRFGRPFKSHAHASAALKRALVNLGVQPVAASYDRAGNCTTCGEAGRCGGWHTPEEAREAQQARAASLQAAILDRSAAPLPTGAGDMTADMFNAGDTPLFNRAWAGGAR